MEFLTLGGAVVVTTPTLADIALIIAGLWLFWRGSGT